MEMVEHLSKSSVKSAKKNQKIFSVPRNEPCANEVFSIMTSIYCRFNSQAPERVLLVNDPGPLLENLCVTMYAVYCTLGCTEIWSN